jgi:glycosyltransferase involved in cell wall biosynthesis
VKVDANVRHPGAARGGWHLLTCEYPPHVGGVASYTRAVAEGLAARGVGVHVWCPGEADRDAGPVRVHAAPDRWRVADLRRVGHALDACPPPRTLFVQWVPHGYGYRSLNVAFAAWVSTRASRGDRVELMVHEPWLTFEHASPLIAAAAAVHRLMMAVLLRSACRVWVSIPAWLPALRRLAGSTDVAWLPVPALLPVAPNPAAVRSARETLAPAEASLVGHFGTYGRAVTDLLAPSLEALLGADARVRVVLLGHGSEVFAAAFSDAHPPWKERVLATGTLDETRLSHVMQACDVMLQPYPDGVSARRTTANSLLAHGCAVVTTRGPLTEGLWLESGAVEAVLLNPADLASAVARLVSDPEARLALGRAARQLHVRVFGLDHTIATLLGPAGREPAVA